MNHLEFVTVTYLKAPKRVENKRKKLKPAQDSKESFPAVEIKPQTLSMSDSSLTMKNIVDVKERFK